jgi:hypothetical protein
VDIFVRHHGSRRKNRASFPWTFSCVTMGLVVSISPCFAQGDREASQEPRRLQEEQSLLGPCDSLDPKVCFDITSAAWSSYQNVCPTTMHGRLASLAT